MPYVEAAMMAIKGSKWIILAIFVGLVSLGIYLAVNSYENLQEELVASEAAAAKQIVAHEITLASLEIQEEAASRWKASSLKYQETLQEQERVRVSAGEESRKIDETLRDHNLTKLALAKPELIERIVNRATRRIIGLLNCTSTSSGCDETDRAAKRDSGNSISGAASTGRVRLDRDGPRPLARSRQSVFLLATAGVRGSGA